MAEQENKGNWQEALSRILEAINNKSKVLDLSHLYLTQLPPELFQLENLKELKLWNNELTALPPEFTQLKQLTILDLSYNQLSSLPNDFSNLSQLTDLSLSSNRLSSLPNGFSNLKQLTSLNLSSNQLSSLPNDFSNLKQLTSLNLSYNQLASLPNDFSNLSQLTSLDLSYNQLASLPNDFSNLKQLTSLDLRNTQLSSLPNDFSNLKQLTSLDLRNTQLSSFPSTITQLKKLEKLKKLDLAHSQLKSLPPEITQLRHLDIVFKDTSWDWNKGINFYGNEETLQHPPIEIIWQGWDAIENYFQEIEKGKDKLYEGKLIFIGEGGAGKTSLMRALRGEAFDPLESKTEGIEVRSITLSAEETDLERNFRLNMWDFGGQEIYKDTHRFFLTRDTIYILVTESRKNINYNDIYYWLNSLKIFAPDAPVLLVQNKCEMHNASLDIEAYKEGFSNLVPWAQLLRTSCIPEEKSTINKLRKTIIQTLCDPKLAPNVGDDIPAKWVDIRADLAKMQDAGKKTLAYDDFIKLCHDYGLTDTQSVTTLAGYFFRIGVFTYYAENLLLKRTIFLDNEWLTKGVYQIIDNAEVQANQGLFTENDLATMYQGTDYAGREAEFANLMREFKICYKVNENERTYRCPLILPEATPETVKIAKWQQADSLHFAFDYQDFMPRGILSTLIVNMHENIYQESLWKHGVVLEYNGAQALVYEGLNKKHIHIYIRGQNKRDFLTIIARELQKIHRELNNLPHEGKLACPCAECLSTPDNPHFFKAHVVFRRWNKGIPTVFCERNDEEISTAQLVGYMTHLPQKMDDKGKIYIENMNMLGGNMMSNDSYNIHGNAKGNIGGQGNTYNEHQQNNGIYTNISNSNIGGNVTIKDNQVHNQQVDIDTETLTAELEALIKQLKAKIANDEDDDNVYGAAKSARKAHTELANGSQQTAIAVLQKSGRWFGEFANNVGANVVAGLILGALPQPR